MKDFLRRLLINTMGRLLADFIKRLLSQYLE